jgi:putative FmdB family regulatory protein
MPLYEYECQSCGRFEALQSFSEKPLKWCPTCSEKGSKSAVKRVVSAPAFHLKGSGWYKTDYGSSGAKGSKSTPSDKGTTDSGSSSASAGDTTAKGSEATKTTAPTKSCGTGCGCH